MNPYAIALLVWLAASVIAAPAIGRFIRGPRTPAPGPAADPRQPHAAPPAPGQHGQIAFTVRGWKCGRIRAWDGDGNPAGGRKCSCHPEVDWARHEQELKNL